MLKKMLFTLIFCQTLINSQECLLPTDYVMEFLRKSGTLIKGQSDWKYQLKNGQIIHTNYMALRETQLFEYVGLAVQAYSAYTTLAQVPLDTLKAQFKIVVENENVCVESLIEDIEVKKNTPLSEYETHRENLKRINGNNPPQCDISTECNYHVDVDYEYSKNTMRAKLTSRCKTHMPLNYFLKNIYNIGK